ELLTRFAKEDPRVRAVRLSRNVGSQSAILCGLTIARGNVVVSMDADLQHPPEVLDAMIARWREGADVVQMVRRNLAHESWIRGVASRMFYRIFNAASRVDIVPNSA